MKKIRAIVLVLYALAMCLPIGGVPAMAAAPQSGKLSVVCTIFPQYDWVRQILGDKAGGVDLTLLLDSGIDLHSFQPSAEDMVKISTSDLFIYVGGESDMWVADALKQNAKPDRIVINLLEALGSGAKIEELVEGMEEEEGHSHGAGGHEDEHEHEGEEAHGHEDEHEHEGEEAHGHEDEHEHEGEEAHGHEDEHEHEGEEAHGHEDEHEHEGEEAHGHSHEGEEVYDEHVWLSLKNAKTFCTAIADALSSLDAANAETYRRNLAAYEEKLSALDAQYQAATSAAPVKMVLFGDRFPFRYLVDDYGISYYAAFRGCSAETEASFETIVFLANKVDEAGLKNVMALEGSDQAIARTIVESTKGKNQRILAMDSMQSVTAGDVEKGVTYLSIMEDNLGVLKEALQ